MQGFGFVHTGDELCLLSGNHMVYAVTNISNGEQLLGYFSTILKNMKEKAFAVLEFSFLLLWECLKVIST